MANTEMKAIGFPVFGGLRLDQALDEVGANASIYEHDIERDGSVGRFRSRDGFQKLNASAASGEYKGLWPHSPLRLLAVKRVSGSEAKIVALDREGAEKTVAPWPETEAPSTFASIGTPGGTYTYMRSNVTTAKVVKFDGTTFTEPTCNIENVLEDGETEKLEGKEFPRGRHMVGWPDAGNVLVVANTKSATGGPNGAASSESHVWFSREMPASAATPVAFEESAFLVLGAGDGEEITGVCVYGSQLYVFKETRFWVVSAPSQNELGQPVFSFREVSLGQGSHIKQVLTEKLKETSDRICWASQDGVFFSTTDGIYQTTGGAPAKISFQLKPLEETVPFEGPMAEFLNGETESFRWPATGITALGKRLFVKRYEFIFVYDINVEVWTVWKMPSVSMAIWTGLTGGGAETSGEKFASTVEQSGAGLEWFQLEKAKAKDSVFAFAGFGSTTPTAKMITKSYALSVPAGASIVGFSVTVWGNYVSTGSYTAALSEVKLLREGTESANLLETPLLLPSSYGSVSAGGLESLGGLSWTPGQANAATSGVVLRAQRSGSGSGLPEAKIDAVGLTVFYLSPESASGVRPRLFCSQTKYAFWNGPTAEEQATFPGWAWQSGLYDLGSEDEKELVKAKLWGAGTIDIATSKDFKAIEPRKTYEMGEATTQKAQNISDKATLFSHRFSGTGKASVQRFVRYLRTTATAGSQSDPS